MRGNRRDPEELPVRQVQVYVVIPPRLLLLDVAGPVEVLRRANFEQARVQFDVRYVGVSDSVQTSIGLQVSGIEPLPETLPDGAMLVLAGDVKQTMTRHGRADTGTSKNDIDHGNAIVAWLRRVVRPGHNVVCICSGALLAAQAGLLDGYACTTHHLCCAELAALAPKAKVLDNRLYVEDGERYTSAGIMAGVDLMLHILGKLTDDACAAAVARYLVAYLRRSGSDPQLSPWLEGRNHVHPAVHRVQDAIAQNPAKSWSLNSLARLAGASSRHLSRLFHEHTGMSVTDYRNRLRATLARELISQTQLDIEHVAERAGFGSTRQLRRAWRRLYGNTPRQARVG